MLQPGYGGPLDVHGIAPPNVPQGKIQQILYFPHKSTFQDIPLTHNRHLVLPLLMECPQVSQEWLLPTFLKVSIIKSNIVSLLNNGYLNIKVHRICILPMFHKVRNIQSYLSLICIFEGQQGMAPPFVPQGNFFDSLLCFVYTNFQL